jgi:hypothetical protein
MKKNQFRFLFFPSQRHILGWQLPTVLFSLSGQNARSSDCLQIYVRLGSKYFLLAVVSSLLFHLSLFACVFHFDLTW